MRHLSYFRQSEAETLSTFFLSTVEIVFLLIIR